MNTDSSLVDMRSDLMTRPTEQMLSEMLRAGRERRAYGFRDDVDLIRLEEKTAELLAQEDSLFFPTCTMANQAALMTYCSPGTTVLADATAHVVVQEAVSTTGIAGVVVARRSGERGHLTPLQVEEALDSRTKKEDVALVWVENTHNRGGGSVLPAEWQRSIVATCRERGVPVHVDGSRLWNAAVASGRPAADLTHDVDSVATSLNKALGAPIGAMLAGSKAFIKEAERVRGMLGGGWRPTGIIAAAAVAALESLPGRLVDDHAMASELATGLAAAHPWLVVEPQVTNIVVVTPRDNAMKAHDLVSGLKDLGVLVLPFLTNSVRLVVYSEIREKEVATVLEAFKKLGSRLQ